LRTASVTLAAELDQGAVGIGGSVRRARPTRDRSARRIKWLSWRRRLLLLVLTQRLGPLARTVAGLVV
jgi:hypothetical protein